MLIQYWIPKAWKASWLVSWSGWIRHEVACVWDIDLIMRGEL